jgi:hypothetical protein
MKKITKIHVGQVFYLAWTSNSLVVGRPHRKRHLTIMADRGRLAAHLTDETKQHPFRTKHLAAISLEKVRAFQERFMAAGVDGFIDGLVPVDADSLAELGFKISTLRNNRLAFARTFVKPRLRSSLAFREPSEHEMENLERHFVDTLLDPCQLDSLRGQPVGTVGVVSLDGEGEVLHSAPLFYFPDGAVRSDGRLLDPGWYCLVRREHMVSAQARVLLEAAGPKLFAKIERALRFLGFKLPVSAAELEDVCRRLAEGENIEDLRAEYKEKRAIQADANRSG